MTPTNRPALYLAYQRGHLLAAFDFNEAIDGFEALRGDLPCATAFAAGALDWQRERGPQTHGELVAHIESLLESGQPMAAATASPPVEREMLGAWRPWCGVRASTLRLRTSQPNICGVRVCEEDDGFHWYVWPVNGPGGAPIAQGTAPTMEAAQHAADSSPKAWAQYTWEGQDHIAGADKMVGEFAGVEWTHSERNEMNRAGAEATGDADGLDLNAVDAVLAGLETGGWFQGRVEGIRARARSILAARTKAPTREEVEAAVQSLRITGKMIPAWGWLGWSEDEWWAFGREGTIPARPLRTREAAPVVEKQRNCTACAGPETATKPLFQRITGWFHFACLETTHEEPPRPHHADAQGLVPSMFPLHITREGVATFPEGTVFTQVAPPLVAPAIVHCGHTSTDAGYPFPCCKVAPPITGALPRPVHVEREGEKREEAIRALLNCKHPPEFVVSVRNEHGDSLSFCRRCGSPYRDGNWEVLPLVAALAKV